jgi:malonyl-CoA O-methyltransferase
MTAKDIIRHNFSRSAASYDEYSALQDRLGGELIGMLKETGPSSILDIGCGTGNYTAILRKIFPQALIKAIDISEEMVNMARRKLDDDRVTFIVGDAERVDLDEEFDLISSNASFQWFDDLEKALANFKKLLKDGGVILFSTFGPLTFKELNIALRELLGGTALTNSIRFPEKASIRKMLKGNFKKSEVKEKIYLEGHPSLLELLKKIKYSGIRGYGTNKKGFWTSNMVQELEHIYRKRFGEIVTTSQVFFCKGTK